MNSHNKREKSSILFDELPVRCFFYQLQNISIILIKHICGENINFVGWFCQIPTTGVGYGRAYEKSGSRHEDDVKSLSYRPLFGSIHLTCKDI